jgi:isopenicillin N synthase-like dioxygenase
MEKLNQIAVLKLDDFFSSDDEVRNNFIKSLGDSLKEFGFFAIGNHGVS